MLNKPWKIPHARLDDISLPLYPRVPIPRGDSGVPVLLVWFQNPLPTLFTHPSPLLGPWIACYPRRALSFFVAGRIRSSSRWRFLLIASHAARTAQTRLIPSPVPPSHSNIIHYFVSRDVHVAQSIKVKSSIEHAGMTRRCEDVGDQLRLQKSAHVDHPFKGAAGNVTASHDMMLPRSHGFVPMPCCDLYLHSDTMVKDMHQRAVFAAQRPNQAIVRCSCCILVWVDDTITSMPVSYNQPFVIEHYH
ncbi:hypothetical protein BJ166DRAFT_233779 [Pestalotiopsis sp. NC0098]|nr:hypothetical protein BJ166DRAFT_233779 [Pestalotiopsis sp. NC0098]